MKPRLLIALALLAVCAVPAFAADHDITLSSSSLTAQWEGAPHVTRGLPLYNEDARTSIPCGSGPARECEEVLFNVTEAGKFTATVEGVEGTGGTSDVDAYLYKSDASGTQGEKIGSAAANGPDSVTAAKAAPGFYLLVVDYYHSYNSGYKGKVKFTPAAPPAAPAAAPAATEPPAAAPSTPEGTAKPRSKPSKKAACQKKAKKIKNKKKRAKALKKCKKMKG